MAHEALEARMHALVTGVVALGVVLSLAVGAARGFDFISIVLLVFIAAFGALSIAVTRRARAGGEAGPVQCEACMGLISPHAPYCKHCGAPRRAEA